MRRTGHFFSSLSTECAAALLSFRYPSIVLYTISFHFGHICRWDQCAVYTLYSKISTDPGLCMNEVGRGVGLSWFSRPSFFACEIQKRLLCP